MSDTSDQSDWSSAEELEDWNQELSQVLCLFCDLTFKTCELDFEHMKSGHNLDLIDVCVRNRITSIDFIKLINYIRLNKVEAIRVEETISSGAHRNDLFMKPVLNDDRLLTYDIECHDITDGHSEVMVETVISNELSENKVITNKMIEYERRIQELERQLKLTKDLLSEKICDNNSSAAQVNVGQMSTTEDEYYVSSYSHYSIHYEMLSDTIRTKAYQDAILNNGQFFQGKTVLDIGCGTGILSLFAAKAGAELVVAVDHSDIIYKAMEFAIENHLDSRIKFIKGKLEAINFEVCQLPTKYDVIISEWMGYFLLFEGMLDSVLYARNQLLANSGLLLPNTCSLALAGISDKQLKHRFIDFWDDVYGFRMSSMKNEIISEALIDTVDKETINTSVFVVRQFDLMTISLEESQSFETQFQLTALSDKPVLAFAGWFDCHFNASQLTQSVTLSTSPFNCGTHWKQTLFVLKKPIECKSGDTINGQIKVYRNVKEIRSLVVEVKISGRNKQTFFLS